MRYGGAHSVLKALRAKVRRDLQSLGIANALLLGSIFLPQFSNWREPMHFASIGVSGVLGLLAAHLDRRLVAEDDL